jgi:hypothetical protein
VIPQAILPGTIVWLDSLDPHSAFAGFILGMLLTAAIAILIN